MVSVFTTKTKGFQQTQAFFLLLEALQLASSDRCFVLARSEACRDIFLFFIPTNYACAEVVISSGCVWQGRTEMGS